MVVTKEWGKLQLMEQLHLYSVSPLNTLFENYMALNPESLLSYVFLNIWSSNHMS